MRSLVVMALPLFVAGCAMGGATDDEVTRPDAIGLPEDRIEEPFDGGEDDTATDEDALVEEDTAGEPPDTEVPPEDTEVPPEDSGCIPACTTCGAADGCGGTCLTGACASGTCVAGKCEAPVTPTRSYLLPGKYAFGTAWARAITWTVGSEEPATIRYTVDGSAPSASSPSKAAPADIFIASSGATLRWYADNGAKESTKSFTANIATSGQTAYGFIVEKTNLSGKGPVIVVSPGATIAGTASYQAWTSTTCPGCRLQLVYGIGNTSAGCIYDWSPMNWPGASGNGSISVKAPSAPGVYDLNVSYTLELSCANGMAMNPLGVRPTTTIAKVVVR